MKRSVEFDLLTESPNAFARGGASMNAVHAAKRKIKQQRATTADVLRHFGAPPGLYVPCAAIGGEMTGNTFVVTFTRTTPGIGLDKDENLRMAFKHVKDQVADWLGLNDRDDRIEWRYAQEKAPKGRVRIEVEDATPGADRRVVLASEPQTKGQKRKARPKGRPDGDPGEELAARLLVPCPRCRAEVKAPCVGPGTAVYGVHVERAQAAGHIGLLPLDWRGSETAPKPARTGVRKMAQRVAPQQARLPLARCYAALPYQQPTCSACGGSGRCSDEGPPDPCGPCLGTGATGMRLVIEPRVDGLRPPASLAYTVPEQHRTRWGKSITLYPRPVTARGLGTITVYALSKGR